MASAFWSHIFQLLVKIWPIPLAKLYLFYFTSWIFFTCSKRYILQAIIHLFLYLNTIVKTSKSSQWPYLFEPFRFRENSRFVYFVLFLFIASWARSYIMQILKWALRAIICMRIFLSIFYLFLELSPSASFKLWECSIGSIFLTFIYCMNCIFLLWIVLDWMGRVGIFRW